MARKGLGFKRTLADREAALLVAARMHLQGKTQVAISKATGVTQQVVSEDLRELRKRWREASLEATDYYINLELARLDLVEAKAWEGWDGSLGKHVTDREVLKGLKLATGGELFKDFGRSSTTEEMNGDPRYLMVILSCHDRRSKLLALEKRPPPQPEVGSQTDAREVLASKLIEVRGRLESLKLMQARAVDAEYAGPADPSPSTG